MHEGLRDLKLDIPDNTAIVPKSKYVLAAARMLKNKGIPMKCE